MKLMTGNDEVAAMVARHSGRAWECAREAVAWRRLAVLQTLAGAGLLALLLWKVRGGV
jgi:hypothetical protein